MPMYHFTTIKLLTVIVSKHISGTLYTLSLYTDVTVLPQLGGDGGGRKVKAHKNIHLKYLARSALPNHHFLKPFYNIPNINLQIVLNLYITQLVRHINRNWQVQTDLLQLHTFHTDI
jgi:hypothetical protein